jgi:hypothetical protein
VLVLASLEIGAVGIVVGGLATVSVAVITAVTTNRRQRESLRHARELVDLADLRVLLDEAAIALERAGHVREDVEAAFALVGFAIPDEKRQALGEQFSNLGELNARLNLRLGVEDLVSVHFEEANDALYFILEALDPDQASPQAVERSREKILEYGAKSAGHTGAFFTAAVQLAGTAQREHGSAGAAAEAERRAALLAEVTRLASPLR